MHSSLRGLGSEFFWVGLGQGVAALGGVVGVRLLTAYLNPRSYGELALAMTIVLFSQQLILGPLGQAFMRYFAPSQQAKDVNSFLRATSDLIMQATGVILVLAFLAVVGLWAFGQSRWVWIVALASLLSLLTGYNSGLDGIQNAARHRIVVAWHQGIGQWLRFAMAVFLIAIMGPSSTPALLGYSLGAALVLTSELVFLNKLLLRDLPRTGNNDHEVKDCMQQMRRYAWPFAGWGLFTWAQLASDRWALQAFASTGVVGLFAALFQVGYNPIFLLSGLIMQLVAPILFSWAGDASDATRLDRAYRLNYMLLLGAVGITILGTTLAFILHRQIFRLLVAPQYRQVSWLLPFMVLASGLFASGQIACVPFMITGDTQRLLAPKIGTAGLCVLLNFVGAYGFGLTGVVLANATFSMVYLIWVSILARRHTFAKVSLRFQDIAWVLGGTGSGEAR